MHIVPGFPELVPVFGFLRPLEGAAAELGGDPLDHFGLFLHAGLAAVELEEQGRLFLVALQFGEPDAGLHLIVIQQLNAGHWHAGLDGQDHRADSALKIVELTDGGGGRFRNAIELERNFGDHAERAFGANEQPCQIVSGGGFAGPAGGADDLAAGGHHGEGKHVLAHGAVAHGVGAGSAGCRHAADRGIGAGIDREKQALVAQMGVELLARDAGLHPAVKILGIHRKDLVHVREIDADAAHDRADMAFEGSACAEGNHRNAMFGAELYHFGDLFGAVGENHALRRQRLVIALVLTMPVKNGGSC